MPREDHQPITEAPNRKQATREELLAACGRTIGFVMALGEESTGDLHPAIEAALGAGMPAVFVLGSPERASEVADAVRTTVHRKNVVLQAMEYDSSAAIPLTRDAGNFELFEFSYGLIATARAIADAMLDDYDSIVIMNGAQESVTTAHLYELCSDAKAHAGTDVAASWIQWLRRPPYYIARDFLDTLDESPLTQSSENGVKPVPHVHTLDHVFGEEKLAAPLVKPPALEPFFEGCTMSALQAVDLARYALAHPDEELHSPNLPPSLLESVEPKPLSNSDIMMLEAAKKVLREGDDVPAGEAAELAWADAFGKRNKRDFPLLNDRAHAGRLAYLDSAATTQRVAAALQAQRDFDEHENANVYRGAYKLSAQATFTLNDARKRLEDFIGAKRRETVYTANTTTATNLVAQAWGEHNVGAGDVIVCTLDAHHSNFLPFAMLAERKGAQVECVPFDDGGRIDQDAYREALARKPKLVCLAQIGNVFGIAAPVKEMAAAAHAAGARVLVDAAQSFPHMQIDVRDLGVDWVAISAHKAYGPMGIGALWISPDVFDEMDPLGGGGGTVSHVGVGSYYLRPQALQYEMGTPPVSQAVGWAAAIDYLEALGMENVARHSAALTRHFVRGLGSIDGVNIVGDHTQPDGQMGLVSFTVRSVTPAETASFLGRLDVAVRSGGHCALPLHAAMGMIGTGRVSIGVHTTRDDIDAALTAIALCRRIHETR